MSQQNVAVKISERQKQILDIVKENPNILQTELAERFDVRRETIYRDMKKLVEAGILCRSDSDIKPAPEGPLEGVLEDLDGTAKAASRGRPPPLVFSSAVIYISHYTRKGDITDCFRTERDGLFFVLKGAENGEKGNCQ